MNIGRYTTRVEHRPRLRAAAASAAAAVTLVALLALALPAGAASNGSATGTVAVAVRSVSVSTPSFNYDQCTGPDQQPTVGLVIPGGTCATAPGALTETTGGGVPSHIEVSATNFVPADDGTPWQLCANGSTCSGSGHTLGADQAQVVVFGFEGQTVLSNTPTCDRAVNAICDTDDPGDTTPEGAVLEGPASSTDQSSTFSNTITWIAAP